MHYEHVTNCSTIGDSPIIFLRLPQSRLGQRHGTLVPCAGPSSSVRVSLRSCCQRAIIASLRCCGPSRGPRLPATPSVCPSLSSILRERQRCEYRSPQEILAER